MFKKNCLLFGLLFAGCSLMAENILKNSNFSEKDPDGVPLSWNLDDAKLVSTDAKENSFKVVKVKGAFGEIKQFELPLTVGSKYVLSYKVKGATDCQVRVYCAWVKNGEPAASDFAWIKVGGEWEAHTIPVDYDKAEPRDNMPIFYICVQGSGEIEFKDLVLELDKAATPAATQEKGK